MSSNCLMMHKWAYLMIKNIPMWKLPWFRPEKRVGPVKIIILYSITGPRTDAEGQFWPSSVSKIETAPGEHAEVVPLLQADPALSSAGSETVWQFLHGSSILAGRESKNPKFGFAASEKISIVLSRPNQFFCIFDAEPPKNGWGVRGRAPSSSWIPSWGMPFSHVSSGCARQGSLFILNPLLMHVVFTCIFRGCAAGKLVHPESIRCSSRLFC